MPPLNSIAYIVSIPGASREKSMDTRFGVVQKIRGLVLPGTVGGSEKAETGPFRILLKAAESQVLTSAGPELSRLFQK